MKGSHEHPTAVLADLGLDARDHTSELRQTADACRARNRNEEGIPMLLVLETVDGPTSTHVGPPRTGDPTVGPLLAQALALTLDALAPAPGIGSSSEPDVEPGPRELALALEVVASRWFTLGVPERP